MTSKAPHGKCSILNFEAVRPAPILFMIQCLPVERSKGWCSLNKNLIQSFRFG